MSLRSRFPGAHSFEDDDLSRVLFQGRGDESAALAHQILANRLVVLFARSGVGKSSLLAAGVAERLRGEGFVPLTARVNDTGAGAVRSVLSGIAESCRAQRVDCEGARTGSGLWAFFRSATFWKDDVLLCPVLVLDQFEELFTLYREEDRAALVEDLSCLVRGVAPRSGDGGSSDAQLLDEPPPRLRIVLSLREDFLAHLEELADRVPGLMERRFRLLPLTREQAAAAVTGPLSVEDTGLSTLPFDIRPDARDAILDFLESAAASCGGGTRSSIEPFQLQVICQHVEGLARRKQGSTLAPGRVEIGVEDVGGPDHLRYVLRSFYEAQLAAIRSWRQRQRARRLCSELLVSAHGRRLRLEESEIRRLAGTSPHTLGALVARRILRADQVGETTYYELSHDALVGPIVEAGGVGMVMRSLLLLALVLSGVVVTAFVALVLTVIVQNEQSFSSWEAAMVVPFLASLGLIFYRSAATDIRAVRVLWQRLRNARGRRGLVRRQATG